jgi:hypothetical protein
LLTPRTFRKTASVHQKQPPPKVARLVFDFSAASSLVNGIAVSFRQISTRLQAASLLLGTSVKVLNAWDASSSNFDANRLSEFYEHSTIFSKRF